MNEVVPSKPKRGRPSNAEKAARAQAAAPAAPAAPKTAMRYKMKAKPNWEDVADTTFEEQPDKLRIPKEMIPDGMDLQWVTDSIWGQPMPQHRAEFERHGWTPVHQEDFDGRFDGIWMPKGAQGEIKVEASVLMARPIEYSLKARRIEKRKADERLQIKERELKGGNIPGITLDASHPNAVRSNMMNRSLDGAFVPMPVPKDQ